MRTLNYLSMCTVAVLLLFNAIECRAASLKLEFDDSKEDQVCLTVSGKTCQLPFIWKGKLYKSCTEDSHSGPWCSTRVDGSNSHVTGEWDDCSESCNEQNLLLSARHARLFEGTEEATVEDAPDNDIELNVNTGSLTNDIPEPRTAQSFYTRPYPKQKSLDSIQGSIGDQHNMQSANPFIPNQLDPSELNQNSGKEPLGNHNVLSLVNSVKQLCSLVGSCQPNVVGVCQLDLNMRSGIQMPQFHPQMMHHTYPSMPQPRMGYYPIINQQPPPLEKPDEEEDYSHFSRSFDDIVDWHNKLPKNAEGLPDLDDEKTNQELEVLLSEIENEAFPQPTSFKTTLKQKRHAVMEPSQISDSHNPSYSDKTYYNQLDSMNMHYDPIYNYPMQSMYIPQFYEGYGFDPYMAQPKSRSYPEEKCNCKCDTAQREPQSFQAFDDEPESVVDFRRFEEDVEDVEIGNENNATMHNSATDSGIISEESKDRGKRSIGYGSSHGVNPFYLYSRLAHHSNKHNGHGIHGLYSQHGYGLNHHGYGQNLHGYGQNHYGYGQNNYGYGQNHHSYGQNHHGYGQNHNGYGDNYHTGYGGLGGYGY